MELDNSLTFNVEPLPTKLGGGSKFRIVSDDKQMIQLLDSNLREFYRSPKHPVSTISTNTGKEYLIIITAEELSHILVHYSYLESN